MRDRFNRAWPKIQVVGRELTGIWLGLFALVLFGIAFVGTFQREVEFLRLPVGVFGATLMLAALLIVDGSREDLAEWTVQGSVAIVVAYLLLSGNPTVDQQATVYWLLWLGSVLFGIRAFRGAFRRRLEGADHVDATSERRLP